jgi:hypothetical protein
VQQKKKQHQAPTGIAKKKPKQEKQQVKGPGIRQCGGQAALYRSEEVRR